MLFVFSVFLCIGASKRYQKRQSSWETTLIPNSCINHEDASNVIVKLLEDDVYPALNVRCSNQYMIVNLKQDREWEHYFSTMREYRPELIGPGKDDHANWQEWLLPPMTEFIVSPDCNTCDGDHELNHLYSTSSAYYMTGLSSGCTQLPVGRIGCDMDFNSYACRVCETAQTREPGYWFSYEVYNGLNDPQNTLHLSDEVSEETFAKYGMCGFTIRDAKAPHSAETDTFGHCKTVSSEDFKGDDILPRRKPSIGTEGRFCMCVKPDPNMYTQYSIFVDDVTEKQNSMDIIKPNEEEKQKEKDEQDALIGLTDNIVMLYQDDFEHGTYRITSPGKYVLMEDIVFDFNAPKGYKEGNLDTYNGASDWWPDPSQISDYPGAGDLKDAYFLGFWAGITIECNDVILELNSHKMEMSEAFYYQQSFFAIISLSSQIFLPLQGPGFFGAHPRFAENVMIRNGELGLSSHHGIQGNFNKNVLVDNVKIHDFKTHGIQFNGFDGITIRNVDVGPNRKVDRLTPYYAHMKALLPVYRMMVDREEVARDLCIHFKSIRYGENECVTMTTLIKDIQTLLDMAFEYVVLDKREYDEIDVGAYEEDAAVRHKTQLWNEHRNVVINTHHSTQTATLYGVFLNYIGTNVIGWYAGSESTKSHNVFIDRLKIHDLHHDTHENIGFSQGATSGAPRTLNCINAPFNAYHIFGETQVNDISECNNYYEDNGLTKKCESFRSSTLEYVGNVISDIQLVGFELINNYGLSWNYCGSGAADLAELVDFAIRGTQFEDTLLLVGTHDPMIHPGKGVMGLRLNGVDSVDIKDVQIKNIHSSTGIGSLLGGLYENAVGQQAPYMNGFSMNMVNGFSMTFCMDVTLSDVEVSHIISDTGLAYGVAVWFKTEVQIVGKKGLKIHHVHAGVELARSSRFRRNSFPNLKPEACAFRIYDDVIYNSLVKYDENAGNDENVVIECISGHTGCLMDNDEYTNIGYVRRCEDPLEAYDKLHVFNDNKSNHRSVIGALCVALSIIVIFVIYYSRITRKSSIKTVAIHSEDTPLLP